MAVYQEETGSDPSYVPCKRSDLCENHGNCVGLWGPSSLTLSKQSTRRMNELKLDDLYRAMEIYAETIRRLAAKGSLIEIKA